MSTRDFAAAFTAAVKYARADEVGENHSALQKAILVGNANWWKEHGKPSRGHPGELSVSAKRAREIGRQRVGYDELPAGVYADYLDDIGHPAAGVIRKHLDPERQRVAATTKQRGMFVGHVSWPRPDGLSWAIGTSAKNASHPIWAHVAFDHPRESLPEGVHNYASYYAPLTLDEAKQLADDHESFYGPNGFVEQLRYHIATVENPRRRLTPPEHPRPDQPPSEAEFTVTSRPTSS